MRGDSFGPGFGAAEGQESGACLVRWIVMPDADLAPMETSRRGRKERALVNRSRVLGSRDRVVFSKVFVAGIGRVTRSVRDSGIFFFLLLVLAPSSSSGLTPGIIDSG